VEFKMTYCDTLTEPLKEKIEKGQSLDDIGKSLCGNTVKNPRQKAIRLIKILLGENYLKRYSDTLGYNANKAVRLKLKSITEESEQRNFLSKCSDNTEDEFDKLVESVQKLIGKYGIEEFMKAVEVAQQEGYIGNDP
jgi:hypothetical protein